MRNLAELNLNEMGKRVERAAPTTEMVTIFENEGPLSLWAVARAWRTSLGEKRIPIATDGGGNPFILDMSDSIPKVSICLHDEDFTVVEVAASFSEFIDHLELDPDMI